MTSPGSGLDDHFGSEGTIDDLRELLLDWFSWYNGNRPGLAPVADTKRVLAGHVEVTYG